MFFRERLEHTNIVWNNNGTMTYTAQRTPVFEPQLNTLNLNDTLTVPNLVLLVSSILAPDTEGNRKIKCNSYR
jgi:hypothetical protein